MKKTPSKKLSLTVETIRNLTSNELTQVGGGSHVSLSPPVSLSGTSVISRLPSGGAPSGGSVSAH